MKKEIRLGFEVGTGEEVCIKPSHIIVTGVTQLSGKTTTLEALIERSGLKAIVFKTKIGEKSFLNGSEAPPFFRDRSDYEFVKSLIEAYAKEKLFLEKGTLMRLCKGSGSLIDIKKRVDEILAEGKLRGLKEEIHTRLQHYLDNLIPQIEYGKFSRTLILRSGINIMDLERFSEEAQSLIIQSVADEVLKTCNGVILVIPEAWKFLPQRYNHPCKRTVESFIRQGATNNNFVWIDSQDMSGVDKTPLKQISTWILGYQSERNEVKHTLDQISLPKKSKPKEEDIMTLKKGHFYLSSYDTVKQVYVQPEWLTENKARLISIGKLSVDDVNMPAVLVPYSRPGSSPGEATVPSGSVYDDSFIRKELVDLRVDFFNKIEELQGMIQKVNSEVYVLKSKKPEIDVDWIVSKVLQKTSMNGNGLDEEALVQKVLARVPKQSGSVVYEVAPLEKITKDFLQEAKDKIVSDVQGLNDNSKRMLKYLESKGQGVKSLELEEKCFFMKHSGAASKKVSESSLALRSIGVASKDSAGWHRGKLKDRIVEYLNNHQATSEEIEQVYNHILMEVLV